MATTLSNNGFPAHLPIFDGKNYDQWIAKMKVIFRFQDVVEIVNTGVAALPRNPTDDQNAAHKEQKKRDGKALFIIHQCLDADIFEKIVHCENAKEAWDTLARNYCGDEKLKKVRLQALRRQYELLQMTEGETVNQYFVRLTSLTNQMVRNGEKISDLMKIEKVLRTLTPKFDHIVVAKEESKNLDELKIEELQASLEAHELRLNERSKIKDKSNESAADQALQAQHQKKGKYKKGKRKNQNSKNSNEGTSKGHDHSSQEGNKGQKKKINKKDIQCYNCQKWGHFAAECKSKKVPREESDEAQFVHDNEGYDSEGAMLMAIIKEEDDDDQWYLDTGCSNHMSGKKTWFCELDESVTRKIRFADDSVVNAEGIGKIKIQSKDGKDSFISDVLYVPNMKSNLISIGQLLEKGYTVRMEDKILRIFDNKMRTILKVQMSRQRTFKIGINIVENQCLLTKAGNENWLWHQRFGHLNFGDLNKLQKKKMVIGLPQITEPDKVCDKCCISKQSRSSYNTEIPTRATRKLETIHSDVCGPFEVKSMGGNNYFVSFIDEFTRKLWIYLIVKKSEVLDVFKKFRIMVQNESGEVVSKLRTDGGGEYTSNEFRSFCESNGIKHEVTAPYTPQHNGIAERKNRTIVNMVRSMIKEKGLPTYLWGEATATAVYLLNRCPTKRLEYVTPEEAWSGIKPCVKHLRVFGSLCFRHIPDQLRRKLDDKAQAVVMVGYHSTGSYKLYDPIEKKIMFSKDVKFDEASSWNWEGSSSRKNSMVYLNDTESPVQEVNTNQGGASERPTRNVQAPQRLNDCVRFPDTAVADDGELIQLAMLAESEPVSLEQAMKEEHWRNAMLDELQSIEKNETWSLVKLPTSKKCIDVKWVYKTKLKPDGQVAKYKARLVARGFLQRQGLDYNEVFAPVARMETIRLIIAIASWKSWKMFQLDVKSAFLNGELEEEVYVSQPPGFEIKGKEDYVYRLRKALYGLKQAPRAWNKKIDQFLISQGFEKCITEHGIYFRNSDDNQKLIVCLYVDDMIVTGSDTMEIEWFKEAMMRKFEMSDLGVLSYFLGIEIVMSTEGVLIHQKKYARDILKRFNMNNSKPVTTPIDTGTKLIKEGVEEPVDATLFKQIVGSLRYLCHTRPDITYGVGLISRFMEKPMTSHLVAAKRILRYVKGTEGLGILYRTGIDTPDAELYGYSDSDWSGDVNDRKSTAAYVFMYGNAPFSWCSKKQAVVALSSCEAEYIAASMAACQAQWLCMLMQELGLKSDDKVRIMLDSKSAIDLAKHPVAHGRSKHIETRYHFLRDQVNNDKLELLHCKTEDQLADILTKALKTSTLENLKMKLEMNSTS